MKKFIISLLIVFSLFLTGAGFVQANMMGYGGNDGIAKLSNANIDTALQDIYKDQNISDPDKINCSKITDEQFENLGDAYMGLGITEAQHTAMENMMGGEESTTLKQAHINMGRAYIGCWANYNGVALKMSMMGGSYSTDKNYRGGMMGWGSMMGRGYISSGMVFNWLTSLAILIFVILGIVALLKYIKKN